MMVQKINVVIYILFKTAYLAFGAGLNTPTTTA